MSYEVMSPDLAAIDILRQLPPPDIRTVLQLSIKRLPQFEREWLLNALRTDIDTMAIEEDGDRGVVIEDVFSEIVGSANRDADRALLAASYLAARQERTFRSRDLNGVLADVGKGIKNITNAVDALLKAVPPLIKIHSEPKESKKAQQTYTLTHAGEMKAKRLAYELAMNAA